MKVSKNNRICIICGKRIELLPHPVTEEQKEEQTTTCEIKQDDGKIILDFYSDCGKFGIVATCA